ncbi:MAG: hypothetical protein JO360_16050 [Acidobacteria bacterium]|nr:hypothetical protein [Acidobacteriota bacterium]
MSQSQGGAAQEESGGGGGREQSHFRQSGQGRMGAERGGSLRQKGGIGMVLRRAEEFDLTDKQQDKLNRMRTDFELEKVDLLAALSKAKIIFRSVIRDLDSPEQKVMEAIDNLASAESELRKMRYRHMKQTHAVLSGKQLGSLKAFHKQQKNEKVKRLRLARQENRG